MLKKQYYLILLPAFCLATLRISAQQKITLQYAIDQTLKNNLQLQKSKVTEAEAGVDVFKSEKSKYPTLNLATNGDFNFGRSLDPTTNSYLNQNSISSTQNISSSFTLFQGFQKVNQIRENKFLLESDKSATQKLKNDLTIQVASTYITILNYQAQIQAAVSQDSLARQFLELERKRYEAGKKSLIDVSRAEYQLAKTEGTLTDLRSHLISSKLDLGQLINNEGSIDMTLSEPQSDTVAANEQKISEIYNYAVDNLPEIRHAYQNREAAAAGLEVSKSAYYPVISMAAVAASSYIYEFHPAPSFFGPVTQVSFFPQLRGNLYEYIGFNISVPIVNNYSAKASVEKAKLDLQNALIDEQSVKLNLYKVIMQAVSDLTGARETYQSALQSYSSARVVFEAMQKKYYSGGISSFDLSQARSDMIAAQLTLIYDKYNMIFKRKVIDFYSGIPIAY